MGIVERLARATGLNKTAAVERALDRLLREVEGPAAAPSANAAYAAFVAYGKGSGHLAGLAGLG